MKKYSDDMRGCDNRREFLKKLSLGSSGLAIGSLGMEGCSSQAAARKRPEADSSHITLMDQDYSHLDLGESTVSLVKGSDRREMVYEAMKPFEEEIKDGIRGKQVFIKINCVWHDQPLIATHPDAVRAILDFIKPFNDRPVIIGESTASPRGALTLFEEYGFTPLEREYNVKLIELNEQPTTWHWILNHNMYPIPIRIINTFLDPNNYVFSVTRLKTHNCVVATLTLKNVVMGSPLKIPAKNINDKSKMHAAGPGNNSPKMINYNLFKMAHHVRPNFGILDGFVGAEGNGPTEGEPVDHRVVLAGTDFVAVDRIGSELMGVPWEDIGYLQYCATAGLGQGDPAKINIIGPNPKDHVIKYKMHENIDWQLTWKNDLVLQPIK